VLKLRDYQELSMNGLREGFAKGHRVQMLYLPTGGGKTEIAILMLAAAEIKENKSAMVMDRRVLCDQTSKRLCKYEIDHGVLMAGHNRYAPKKSIQVCTVQTLEARGGFPGLKLLIVDEAHGKRDSVIEFIKNNQHVKVVGLSASPFTKGLGDIYSNVVSKSTTKQLVDSGLLAPLKVFIAKEIDMTGAKKVAGEWSQKEATERGIKVTGDIVNEWIKKTHELFNEPKKTIVFCAGVAHGLDLQEQFKKAGYNFVSISYKDDDDFKTEMIREFSKEESSIHGLIATDILTKGFDQADVFIGISARPFTKSFSSHVQQLGRIMRPHDDKSYAVWLDHSGNYLRFRDQWEELYHNGVSELDDTAEQPKPEPTQKEKEAAKCPKCGQLWGITDICPHCGHVRVRKNDVLVMPGEMVELDGGKKEKYSSEYKETFYRCLLGYAKQHRYKEGWAYWQYKEKFGIGPAWKKIASEPSADVINWIKYQNIKKAKARMK
jgi:superfamily II DNA or RNA helicase